LNMNKTFYLYLAIPIIIIGLFTVAKSNIFSDIYWITQAKVHIDAHIKLENNCDIPSSYFAIRKLENGRRFSIARGETTIKAIRGEKMQLVLSAKYKDVEYDGNIFRAEESQTVYADCSQGERQQSVTDGLRGTFKN